MNKDDRHQIRPFTTNSVFFKRQPNIGRILGFYYLLFCQYFYCTTGKRFRRDPWSFKVSAEIYFIFSLLVMPLEEWIGKLIKSFQIVFWRLDMNMCVQWGGGMISDVYTLPTFGRDVVV